MNDLSMLTPLMHRGSEFLGVKYPILCGAMTWVSEPKLVSAVCNAGGFGCLAGGNAPCDILEKQIMELKSLTANNFAVNLITIAPAYKDHLAMLDQVKVPYIIFAGSFPKEKEILAAKATGAKVLCFASALSIAERMIRFGADGIILEGSEAGGHIGHVSSMVLIQQILYKFHEQIPIFIAGGIGTGKMMAHLLTMGAAGVQLGTRFVMTKESTVHPAFKEAFRHANARDAISTPQYDQKLPVVAVRALRNKG
ncbi:MAG: nitronate monooxygenase, partial [Victivallales bacterium]|nr:nitronate monooxygenase [Victivallales bacterium]